MNDVFRAGVEPGGLTMDYEIKVLICYMLAALDRPLPAQGLVEVLSAGGIANYFEAVDAVSSLLKSGHIEERADETGENCYVVTPVGRSAAETFEKDLPSSVRQHALEGAQQYLLHRRRRAQNRASITRVADGYQLSRSIEDVGSNLLDLTVLLPSRESCQQARERFFNDPVTFYQGLLELLLAGQA